jgi:hypothetical protein
VRDRRPRSAGPSRRKNEPGMRPAAYMRSFDVDREREEVEVVLWGACRPSWPTAAWSPRRGRRRRPAAWRASCPSRIGWCACRGAVVDHGLYGWGRIPSWESFLERVTHTPNAAGTRPTRRMAVAWTPAARSLFARPVFDRGLRGCSARGELGAREPLPRTGVLAFANVSA